MLAPLVIFAFNRPQSLERLLADLAQCRLVGSTDVTVFIDGPRTDSDRPLVDATAEVARSSALVTRVVTRPANRGLAASVIAGVSETVERHGRVIVLEDDLRLSPGFLEYMNQMLDLYADSPEVMQVAAFGLAVNPPSGYTSDVYFYGRASSWGWATWADRWRTVDWTVSDYPRFRRNPLRRWSFSRLGSDVVGMLRAWREGRNSSWAIRFVYSMWSQRRLAVTPLRSLTRNDGFGAGATHCDDTNFYRVRMDDGTTRHWSTPSVIAEDTSITRQCARYYSLWTRFLNGRKLRAVKQTLRRLLPN